jgi:hypothetical protein
MDAKPDEQFDDERNTDGGYDHENRHLKKPPYKDAQTGETVYEYTGRIDTGSGSGDTDWEGEQRTDEKGNVTFRRTEYKPHLKDDLKIALPPNPDDKAPKDITLKNVKLVVTQLNPETGKYVTQIQLENGRLYEAVTDGHGHTESFNPKPWVERDDKDHITRIVDAAGREFKFGYDDQGNLNHVQGWNVADFRLENGKWLNYKDGKKEYNGTLQLDQETGIYSFTDNEHHQTTQRLLDGSSLVMNDQTHEAVSMTTANGITFSYTWENGKIKQVKRSDGGTFTRGKDGVHFDGSKQGNLIIEVDPATGLYRYSSDQEAATYYPDGRVQIIKK